MNLIKSILVVSFQKKFILLNFLFLSIFVYSQEEKTSTLKFNFICDHSQTTIVADQSIMIYVMSTDKEMLVKGLTYCSRKELKLPKGTYSVIIESSKYCTHVIDKYVVADAEQKIEVDLLEESDPECKNEQNFEPHPTRFN
jgi:hypothetical protein